MVITDLATITQVIGTLGFPIACVIILFWYVYQRDKAEKEEREMHAQEVAELKDAIMNNTVVMQKLVDKLSPENEGGEDNA